MLGGNSVPGFPSPPGQSAWTLLSAGPVHEAQARRRSSPEDRGDVETGNSVSRGRMSFWSCGKCVFQESQAPAPQWAEGTVTLQSSASEVRGLRYFDGCAEASSGQRAQKPPKVPGAAQLPVTAHPPSLCAL